MVGTFTRYMELLLLRAPSSSQKLWLAKVLVDEYGEGSEGDDHATLYLDYLRKLGVPEGEEWERFATVRDVGALQAFLDRVPFFAKGSRRLSDARVPAPAIDAAGSESSEPEPRVSEN